MPKTQSPSELEKLQFARDLLEEIISLGQSVTKGLVNGVSCPNWIRKLLIGEINPTDEVHSTQKLIMNSILLLEMNLR